MISSSATPAASFFLPLGNCHQVVSRVCARSYSCLRVNLSLCAPRVFCASKTPSFLARWRVRGPAGTGSVGDSVGEGALDRGTGTSREEAEEEEGL